MADEKEPMQANGVATGSSDRKGDESRARPDMEENAGESGGGAYPHPKNRPENAQPQNTFMGHGGQSDMGDAGANEFGSAETGQPDDGATSDND
jgi:hypothetical protein